MALIDLIEFGSIRLVKDLCLIKIPKSPNWLWTIENSNFLIFSIKLILKIKFSAAYKQQLSLQQIY